MSRKNGKKNTPLLPKRPIKRAICKAISLSKTACGAIILLLLRYLRLKTCWGGRTAKKTPPSRPKPWWYGGKNNAAQKCFQRLFAGGDTVHPALSANGNTPPAGKPPLLRIGYPPPNGQNGVCGKPYVKKRLGEFLTQCPLFLCGAFFKTGQNDCLGLF